MDHLTIAYIDSDMRYRLPCVVSSSKENQISRLRLRLGYWCTNCTVPVLLVFLYSLHQSLSDSSLQIQNNRIHLGNIHPIHMVFQDISLLHLTNAVLLHWYIHCRQSLLLLQFPDKRSGLTALHFSEVQYEDGFLWNYQYFLQDLSHHLS